MLHKNLNMRYSTPSSLQFHTLENEVVVYDDASGKLHLLPLLGANLLMSMQQNSTMTALINAVFTSNEFKPQEATDTDIQDAEMIVKQFMDSYRNLGLVD